MDTLQFIAIEIWNTFFILSPFLLLGLLASGIMHVWIPQDKVKRYLGQSNFKSITLASAFGVPLPLCSCGVIPVSVALHKKGAKKPNLLSFLITTPESSVDSFLLTWVLFGPIIAIYRTIASLGTGIFAGLLGVKFLQPESAEQSPNTGTEASPNCCHSQLKEPEEKSTNDCKPAAPEKTMPNQPIFQRIFRFAFIDLADDILFSLFLGILFAGIILTFFPSDVGQYAVGQGALGYLLMLLLGIPIYTCASASTPIAAAFLTKGISPGAALVFLLSGPATNITTLVVLGQQFGKRFLGIYTGSVVIGSLATGIFLDLVILRITIPILPELSSHTHSTHGTIYWIAAPTLLLLSLWRFKNGAFQSGWKNLTTHLKSFREVF